MSQSKDSSSPKGNGIINPGGLSYLGFAPLYLAPIPLTSYLACEGGVVQRLIKGVVGLLVPGAKVGGGAGDRTVAGLAVLYTFVAFAATGAVSVAGQASASSKGLDNRHPRSRLGNLTNLPLRLRSAHMNIIEHFPAFAMAASLAASFAPQNAEIVNLLGLHILVKLAVYYPAYLLDVAEVRSLAHLTATAAVINVGWRLAKGAT